MSTFKATVGYNIRRFRRAAGWKTKQFAEKLDITPASVSAWETGVKFPNDIEKVAAALGCSWHDLVYDITDSEHTMPKAYLLTDLSALLESDVRVVYKSREMSQEKKELILRMLDALFLTPAENSDPEE